MTGAVVPTPLASRRDQQEYLTVPEVAELLRVARATVDNMIRGTHTCPLHPDGEAACQLDAIALHGRGEGKRPTIRIVRSSLERYLNAHQVRRPE